MSDCVECDICSCGIAATEEDPICTNLNDEPQLDVVCRSCFVTVMGRQPTPEEQSWENEDLL